MPSRSASRRNALLAAVAAVLLVLAASGALKAVTAPLTSATLNAAAPGYAAGSAVARAFDALFADGADPAADAVVIDSLRAENAKLRALAAENEALKAALGFTERYKDDAVLARVVAETDADALKGVVIDRGTDDGIVPGQPVVAGDGVLVGKVFEARSRSATVILLSDSKSRVAVAIQNATDTIGVLEGDRGLSMGITLIPQTEKLSPGDIVVTSGIEPGIRRGLVVGVIEKVNKNTQDPFQSASVAPLRTSAHPIFVQVLRFAEAR
jgi:rod shape-determining protein MreC